MQLQPVQMHHVRVSLSVLSPRPDMTPMFCDGFSGLDNEVRIL